MSGSAAAERGGGRRGVGDGDGQANSSSGGGDLHADENEELLDRCVFDFWIASIKQKVAFNIFQNPLLHFTAVLGIHPDKLSYVRAADYMGQLAGLVWCSWLLMLEHVFDGQSDDPEELDFTVLETFLEQHHEWLADGTHTPFSNMIMYMAYGKGYREKEGGLPKIMWEDDETALRFKGNQITVLEFRDAACACVDEAERLMNELMFGYWPKVKATVDMARIVDSLTFEGSGRSFATNHKNKWLKPGYRRVAHLGKDALWRDGKGWRRDEVIKYLALLWRFKLMMMIVAHIWLG